MNDAKDMFSIGDDVVVTDGFFKDQQGIVTNFDFQYGLFGIAFRELMAVAYIEAQHVEHLHLATSQEAETVTAKPGENPEKLDDEGGVWDTKAVVIEGRDEGLEGELIGPNKILSQKLGAEMIDLRFEDGTVRSVRLENVEFRPLVDSEEPQDAS